MKVAVAMEIVDMGLFEVSCDVLQRDQSKESLVYL